MGSTPLPFNEERKRNISFLMIGKTILFYIETNPIYEIIYDQKEQSPKKGH